MNHNRDWRTAAACRNEDPELFFPQGTEGPAALQIQQAKAICRRCPSVETCLQIALDENIPAGIFGGLTDTERQSLRRAATRKNLASSEIQQRARQTPTQPKPNTLRQLFETNTVRIFGGHLAWTGNARPYFKGTCYTPKVLAYIVDRGRDPNGRVLNDCDNSECVLPAHVADDAERMRCGTRAGYMRHRRNSETPCDSCRQANRRYENSRAAA